MIEYFLPLELKEGTPFVCPVCGNQISEQDKSEICPHVLFIYDNIGNEFIYCAGRCEQVVEDAVDLEKSKGEDVLENVFGALKATTTIFFEVTLSGLASGPGLQTLTIGIDLSY